jgi:hypothetical protein
MLVCGGGGGLEGGRRKGGSWLELGSRLEVGYLRVEWHGWGGCCSGMEFAC